MTSSPEDNRLETAASHIATLSLCGISNHWIVDAGLVHESHAALILKNYLSEQNLASFVQSIDLNSPNVPCQEGIWIIDNGGELASAMSLLISGTTLSSIKLAYNVAENSVPNPKTRKTNASLVI